MPSRIALGTSAKYGTPRSPAAVQWLTCSKSLATVPHPPPRSILKPTMPPLREIPAHISTRKGSPKKATPPSAQKTENLIDFELATPGLAISGSEKLANPFEVAGSPAVNETRVTLRTEEEQQAAAREREERERKELEKEIISRRDARRKSLANRRVSFAPEATLHTWDVVVEYQDSTTSSNSTNSTRRASSVSNGTAASPHTQNSGLSSSDPAEAPSTPPEKVEEATDTASPAHQRDLHQKKRRRSSGIPPMNFNNPDDEGFSSSPMSGSSNGDADEIIDDGSISDSADEDGTMMSLDGGETTNMSMASIGSGDSTGTTRLDEALKEAARQAGTQGIEFDEHGGHEPAGEEEGVAEEEEVVASFAPWSTKAPVQNLNPQKDQENINPFSPAFKIGAERSDAEDMTMDITMDMTRPMGRIMTGSQPVSQLQAQEDENEMSMDVTRAFGNILPNAVPKAAASRRKSMPTDRRRSTRRRSALEETSMGDETMEFTMAMGGIQPSQDEAESSGDEDMTMEFTSAVGGVLSQFNSTIKSGRRASMASNHMIQDKSSRRSLDSTSEDETMDMTVAMGGIVPSILEPNLEQDATVGMEITTALGGILPPRRSTGSRSQAKKVMEMEADLGSSPFRAEVPPISPPKMPAPSHTVASETGSPSLAGFRGKGARRSAETRQSITPRSKSRLSNGGTPIKKPATPSKQITPLPARANTPSKTPPSKNVVMRTASPKKLFKDEIKDAASNTQSVKGKKLATPSKLFQVDNATGTATPHVVLTPQPRRSSGIGLDRTGLGSPRVAAILDRRGSIGDQARSFVPSKLVEAPPAVRFEDPRVIEAELDKERQEESERENGRKILEREADQGEEKDVTLNLKELIQSLTPKKKNPLRGRKSLHVGAAKGVLGKRPVELDNEEEEEEDNGGVKRLKGHQGSPVKSVKLQAPPTKSETTTGRVTRASRKSTELATPTTASPEKVTATTPRHQGRFKDAEAEPSSQGVGPLVEKPALEDSEVDGESFGDDRIQLQDFLNMTSIRFMELTTTKRRHTIAPRSSTRAAGEDRHISLEDCVAAGAATIPMLELFQHVSRESLEDGMMLISSRLAKN